MTMTITDFDISIDGVDFPCIADVYVDDADPSVGYGGDFDVERVQIEVTDNIWADLNRDHFHLVNEQIHDAYMKQIDDDNLDAELARRGL